MSLQTQIHSLVIRVADEFKVFTNIHSTVVDPKNFDENSFVDINKDVCVIPPNSFALARSVEYFRIPRNVLTICVGKSTYARCGIITNVTPFEPEWEGYVTLEISNTTPLPAKIYANEGIQAVALGNGSNGNTMNGANLVTAVGGALVRWPPIGLPIFLVIVGAAASLIPGLDHVSIDPEVFLLLFIPPVRDLGWRFLRKRVTFSSNIGAARIALVDNRANDLAGYDDSVLLELLESMPDLAGTGFDDAFLAELIGDATRQALTAIIDLVLVVS